MTTVYVIVKCEVPGGDDARVLGVRSNKLQAQDEMLAHAQAASEAAGLPEFNPFLETSNVNDRVTVTLDNGEEWFIQAADYSDNDTNWIQNRAALPEEDDADSNGNVWWLRSGRECLGKWNKVPVDATAWTSTGKD